MSERQSMKTHLSYSYTCAGTHRAAVYPTHHARLHESGLKAIEAGLTKLIEGAAERCRVKLLAGEPNVFIFDLKHVKE